MRNDEGPSNEMPSLGWGHADWLGTDSPENDVVLSSRVRLARNLAGHPFAPKASDQDRALVLDIVRASLARAGRLADQSAGGATIPRPVRAAGDRVTKLIEPMLWFDLHRLERSDRDLLVERHQISKGMLKGSSPRAAAIASPSERLSLMVNEEDHIRIQALRPGFSLSTAMDAADDLDDALEETIDYAFDARWGYLTACPTNLGTGIRVSVMVHVPALRMLGEIEKVKRAANDMSLAVRGFWGEGSDTEGDFFQLSNQTTLGRSERVIMQEFEGEIMPAVIEYERRAREKLAMKSRDTLIDDVRRALGTLTHAHLLATGETMTLLSRVRLGLTTGVLEPAADAPGLSQEVIHALMLLVQPAHLSRALGREVLIDDRKAARAEIVRRLLLRPADA